MSEPVPFSEEIYEECYEPVHHTGRGGNCLDNTRNLVTRFEETRVDISGYNIVTMWYLPYPGEPHILNLEEEMVRDKSTPRSNQLYGDWYYHTFLVDGNKRVYDLATLKEYWGRDFKEYVELLFKFDITYCNGTDRINLNIVSATDLDNKFPYGGKGEFTLQDYIVSLGYES